MAFTTRDILHSKGRIYFLSFTLFALVFMLPHVAKATRIDTIKLSNNQILVTKDSVYDGTMCDLVLLNDTIPYKVKKNREVTNAILYDSISSKTKKIPMLHNAFNAIRIKHDIKVDEDSATTFNEAEATFFPYDGKIIRKIDYMGVDIFEGDVQDTSKYAVSWGGRFFNRTHYNTRTWVLRNYIRFKPGDRVDPKILGDNERILRGLGFIEDSRIYLTHTTSSTDSVDVIIVTKDNFPIGADAEVLSHDHFIVRPYTTNFIGLGHNLTGQFIYKQQADNRRYGYGAHYQVNNLFGGFVSAKIGLSLNDEHELYNFKLKKPFLTTDIRFGGELDYYQITEKKHLDRQENDSILLGRFNYTANVSDAWAGYSVKYFCGRNNHFMNVALRLYDITFLNRPYFERNFNFTFHNQQLLLTNLTYRKIDFMKTSKLLGFGRTEDVAHGYMLNFTPGIQKTQFFFRNYLGADYAWAKYYRRSGYFSLGLSACAYKRGNTYEDVLTGARFNFYSPLIKWSSLQFRNAFKSSFVSLTNPLYYNRLDFGTEMPLLKQESLFGNTKFSFTAHTIFYTNINIIGFKVNIDPYINLGWLSNKDYFYGRKQFFAVYGTSFHVKNESLTIPAMQVNVGYLPHTINGQPKIGFSFKFKDLSLLTNLTRLKPEIVNHELFK